MLRATAGGPHLHPGDWRPHAFLTPPQICHAERRLALLFSSNPPQPRHAERSSSRHFASYAVEAPANLIALPLPLDPFNLTYCAVCAVDTPVPLVSVTCTEAMLAASSLTLKFCVYVKADPYATEAGSANQVANT